MLSYAYNARGGNLPTLRVTLGGSVVHEASFGPVGGSAPYFTTNITFFATAASMSLTFSQEAAGDNSLLLDDVRVRGAPPTQPPLRIAFDPLFQSVRIAWPFSAGLDWSLQSSDTVPEGFVDTGLPVWPEDPEYAVYDDASTGTRFYRLVGVP